MRSIAPLLVALCVLFAWHTPSLAQTKKASAQPVDYTKAMASGNKAYNASKYAQAQSAYIKAIQLYPNGAAAYRNLARTYFWQNQYSAALHFYDVYLVNNPKVADKAQIQQERKLASARAPAQPWSPPAVQQKALLALEKSLANGVGYARGSGAYHDYEALLRTEYADPSLARLRQRVSLKLLLEHDELLQTKPGQPTPKLTIDAWDLQRARLLAARRVASADIIRTINDRLLLSKASKTLLLKDYKLAATQAKQAAKANPDMLFVQWFHIVALFQSNDLTDATTALNSLAKMLRKQDPSQLAYIKVMRAMLLQKQGKIQEASTIYQQTLTSE